MPIYEYRCADCRKKVSVFFRSYAAVSDPKCPLCGGTNLERLFSRVVVRRGGGSPSASGSMGGMDDFSGMGIDPGVLGMGMGDPYGDPYGDDFGDNPFGLDEDAGSTRDCEMDPRDERTDGRAARPRPRPRVVRSRARRGPGRSHGKTGGEWTPASRGMILVRRRLLQQEVEGWLLIAVMTRRATRGPASR